MSTSALEDPILRIPEHFDRSAAGEFCRELETRERSGAPITLDLSQVESFDSAGMALVVDALERARQSGRQVDLLGIKGPVLDFFSLLSVERLVQPEEKAPKLGTIESVGAAVIPVIDSAKAGAHTVGGALWDGVRGLFRGQRPRLGRTVEEIYVAGIGGVPIVTLIAFLLGMILAMQAWVQLRLFGADIFVADMVAVSVTREIGPLMTAILIAARSGSSIAAQLGTMVINEEVAALTQMGVHPGRYLVVPKVLALSFATPCLALLFVFVAIVGGAFFGTVLIGIEPGTYLEATHKALHLGDLVSCLTKAMVFGGLVAMVGCGLGLNVSGGPRGGRPCDDGLRGRGHLPDHRRGRDLRPVAEGGVHEAQAAPRPRSPRSCSSGRSNTTISCARWRSRLALGRRRCSRAWMLRCDAAKCS
jgi:phospholipid/cholesterol/gamma-HCH transport system permease protein